MTTQQTQLEKPSAPAEGDAIEITRHWNCTWLRWPCPLCGNWTERQKRHYHLGDRLGRIICDDCGEHPEQISDRIHRYVRNPSGDDQHPDYDSWMAEERRQAIEANAQSDEDFF